eukprot:TRINITY_DN3044_c0_g1_i1.p1 TRINITY_DN3044_c0_g1~~TRINITY_DN3044_c0_g1_i1.p1  ORF type:complete len:103 (-),score=12.65 TRINITY_DN3044_c0_g1_i1:654-962(-)
MEPTELPIDLTDVEDQIKNLNALLNQKYLKLKEEVKMLQQEKASFDTVHKTLMTFKDPIKLNVGGTIFTTSKATLTKEDSMLKAMFSGRHQLEVIFSDTIFI